MSVRLLLKSKRFQQRLNPLTRIHCLPTFFLHLRSKGRTRHRLNPLTRIHCLPTFLSITLSLLLYEFASQSPDEDSLSSDCAGQGVIYTPEEESLNPLTRIHCLPTTKFMSSPQDEARAMSQSPDEDSLSSDTVCRWRVVRSSSGAVSIP